MKKILALVLTFILLMLLVGCQELEPNDTETPQISSNNTSSDKKILKAWTGEFTEDTLKSVIKEYQKNYSNIAIKIGDASIDLYVAAKWDGKTVTIPIDWWYTGNSSWVNDYSVWSYLIRVKDANDNDHYYYFRVDYSAYAE